MMKGKTKMMTTMKRTKIVQRTMDKVMATMTILTLMLRVVQLVMATPKRMKS